MNAKNEKVMSPLGKLVEEGVDDKIILNGLGHDGKFTRNEIERKEWNRPQVNECDYTKLELYPLCISLTECDLC